MTSARQRETGQVKRTLSKKRNDRVRSQEERDWKAQDDLEDGAYISHTQENELGEQEDRNWTGKKVETGQCKRTGRQSVEERQEEET